MPVIVSFFIRQFIIIAVQLGIFTLIERWIVPLINSVLKEIMIMFGVDETEAGNILANEIITTAEALGLTVALSKARLPIILADKLGFTTKGFKKRILKGTTSEKIAGKSAASDALKNELTLAEKSLAGKLANAGVSTLKGIGFMFSFLEKRLNTVFLGFLVGVNVIDFGNWNSGAYQKTFQKIFSVVSFGLLKPDEDWRGPKTLSDEVFGKVYEAYKLEGAIFISDPYKMTTVPFTRDNLLDLMDKVGAHLLTTQKKASTANVLEATQIMILFKEGTPKVDEIKTPAQVAQTPIIKVLTGVISQGKLSETAEFQTRPDDLIESLDELNTAIENNLPAFLTALPRRILYELKIISTVITKDGYKLYGATQQVISKYKKDGTPQYKTVTNRFAVIDIYVWTARNVKSKIDSIILGPVDSVKLQIQKGDTTTISENIQKNMITSDIKDIKIIQTSAPVSVQPAPAPTPAPVITPTPTPLPVVAPTPLPVVALILKKEDKYYKVRREGRAFVIEKGTDRELSQTEISAAGLNINLVEEIAPPPATPIVVAKPASCSALTVAEFYDPTKIKYPSVAERAKIYDKFYPGQGQWYTGTAEQNVKLLTALKQEQGC